MGNITTLWVAYLHGFPLFLGVVFWSFFKLRISFRSDFRIKPSPSITFHGRFVRIIRSNPQKAAGYSINGLV
jgi:hypothetical protein